MMTERTIESKTPNRAYLIPVLDRHSAPIPLSEHLSLGRDPSSSLVVADSFVSGRHARIERREAHYIIRDLRSRNGTYVNGTRILEAALREGDVVRIGEREYAFSHQISTNPQSVRALTSKNPRWNQTLQNLPVLARSSFPVLLLGPSGSGKEVLARQIHENSPCSQGPLVSVNCSAFGESLAESELFGHMRGSFTGALQDRKGAFESARGGTLFLDEIGDLPLSLQPKLLRALENKEIRPVGSDRSVTTNVRVIAATHQNLTAQVESGQFRSDLFFRLNVIRIDLPSLNDRMEDFEDLAFSFAREMRVSLSATALIEMRARPWPGNIRELRNTLARAAALFPGERIQPEHLNQLLDSPRTSDSSALSSNSAPLSVLKEIEKEVIRKRLIANRGNQRRTAAELRMPKSTLHDRIRAYGIELNSGGGAEF